MPRQRRAPRRAAAAQLRVGGLALAILLLVLALLARRLGAGAVAGDAAIAPTAVAITTVTVPTRTATLVPTAAPVPTRPPATPAPPAPPPTSAPPSPPTAGDDAARAELLRLINELRAANGCAALAPEARLAQAAQGHAQDLRDHGRFEHTGSDGSTLSDRLARAGYPFGRAGENIVGGVASPAEAMALWTEGDENPAGPHRQNILNCAFTEAGIGLAYAGDGAPYWVLDLAVRG